MEETEYVQLLPWKAGLSALSAQDPSFWLTPLTVAGGEAGARGNSLAK